MRVTLWNDPHDCGLRIDSGWIRCPRDFHEGNPGSLMRVPREKEKEISDHVGDMMPQTPGEFSHVEIPPGLFPGRVNPACGRCGGSGRSKCGEFTCGVCNGHGLKKRFRR